MSLPFDYQVTGEQMTSVADAIRAKTFTTLPLSFPTDFISAVNSIHAISEPLNAEDAAFINDTAVSYTCYTITAVTRSIGSYIRDHHGARLQYINFPNCTTIASSAFASGTFSSFSQTINTDCSALQTVSLPACRSINGYAFQKCTNLESLYLMGSQVCTLGATNAFAYTKLSGRDATGHIYVPSTLYAYYTSYAYPTYTNWGAYSSRFVSVPV